MDLKKIQLSLQEFAKERDWQQFHSPKNLVMALNSECGELTEIFQWLTPKQASEIMLYDEKKIEVEDELADVFLYLIRLADKLNVDLEEVSWKKIEKNAQKYPIELARGTAKKYTEF